MRCFVVIDPNSTPGGTLKIPEMRGELAVEVLAETPEEAAYQLVGARWKGARFEPLSKVTDSWLAHLIAPAIEAETIIIVAR